MNKIEYNYHDNYYTVWYDGNFENCTIQEVYVKNDVKNIDITEFYNAVIDRKIHLLSDKYELYFQRDVFTGSFLIKEVFIDDIEITDFYEAIEIGKIDILIEDGNHVD